MNKHKHKKSSKPKSEFQERVVQIDRVNRVVSGGRRLRFRATVIIGDMKHRVGLGVGKADEVVVAVHKAVAEAKRNLVHVPVFEGTIPHQSAAKYKASKVLLFPASKGTGIIAGGSVRTVLELAGVKDVLSKTHGSRHKINSTQATIDALTALRIFRKPKPQEEQVETKGKDEKETKKPATPMKPAPKKEDSKSKKKESVKKDTVEKAEKESAPKEEETSMKDENSKKEPKEDTKDVTKSDES